jgi:hypothetical protein
MDIFDPNERKQEHDRYPEFERRDQVMENADDLRGFDIVLCAREPNRLRNMLELPLPERPRIHTTQRPGLIVEEDRSAPVASAQAWVRMGAIHVGAGGWARGLSH